MWEIIHGIVGLMGDIDVAINREGTVHEHGKGVHELLAGGITSCDKVTTAIELIKIGSAIHGAEAGVSLVVELGEAKIILRGGFIRGETGDSV